MGFPGTHDPAIMNHGVGEEEKYAGLQSAGRDVEKASDAGTCEYLKCISSVRNNKAPNMNILSYRKIS